MLLTEILEKNAREFPGKTALVMRMGYRTVLLTYREVYELSLEIACFLEQHGIRKGDRALLLAPNSPYWICVFWGTLLHGAVLVPLNIQSTAEMVRKIAAETEAKILFKYLHYKQPLPVGLKSFDVEFIRDETVDVDATRFEKAEARESDFVEIMYTSGTTGEPKGVMLTHKNISSNIQTVSSVIPLSPRDKFLSILPLSHIFEQVAGFLIPFSAGAEIVFAHSPAAIGALLKEHGITKMVAVPEFLKLVMNKIEARAQEAGRGELFQRMLSLSQQIGIRLIQRLLFRRVHKQFGGRLKTVASGGAPLDPKLEGKWEALGITLLQGYGLTETSPVVSTNTYEAHRIGSVGKIIPGVEVKIASDGRPEGEPRPKGAGEILVKGPNVFPGYYRDETKTREAFTPDGWFKTGDMGELDQDGFLFLKGRKKYLIKGPGAENVWPEDIEFELNKVPGVKDSAVVGLDTPGGMVEIHAVLLFDPTLLKSDFDREAERITGEANRHLASYQQITGWSVWPDEDFPRSATRKVKKEEVLKWLREKKPVAAAPPPQEPKTPLMRLVAEITGTPLGEIRPQTKIVPELHLDSLLRIELASRIEEKFGVEIDEAKITPATTVAELEATIQVKAPAPEKPSLHAWPRSWFVSLDRVLDQTLIIFPFLKLWVTLRVEGAERLRGMPLPAIFMPNHVSYLDSAALAMALPFKIRRRLAFAAAQDVVWGTYRHLAWLAEYFFNAFPFPRREGENIKLGLGYMGRLLDQGWSVVLYPEGQLSQTAALQPLKRGAGLVAIEMDAPIVPVKISGTAEVMPYGKLFPRRRGVVTVRFGAPLRFSRRDSYIEATGAIESALRRL